MFDLRVCVVELEATLMLCEIFSIKNHITIKNDLQPMNALFLQAIIFHSFLYIYIIFMLDGYCLRLNVDI